MESVRRIKQVKKFTKGSMTVILRFDDRCGNGHNTFSITGEIVDKYGEIKSFGCLHEDIKERFPEFAHLIPYHGCTTEGPTYYVENTLYRANDKDHNGLRKGEKKQIKNGRTGKLCWRLITVDENDKEIIPENYIDSLEQPQDIYISKYIPWYRIGEGKEPDLEAARSCAVWPDATLEQLRSKEQLMARLPKLIEDFRNKMLEIGFEW